jgi:indolepyruvate ferredoxin oxidoreductase beta subunit
VKDLNFLLAGVGGQGTLLASNVVAQVGVAAGLDVKKAEVHGMAQRGGSVNSHVRWGKKLYSPLIGQGEVDYMVVLERLESLRYLGMLRPGGTVLIGEMRIPPLTVSSGDDVYPKEDVIREQVATKTDKLILVPSLTLAEQAGTARAHNVVVLGALSTLLDARHEGAPVDVWRQVISRRVPQRYVDVNMAAFEAGRQAAG